MARPRKYELKGSYGDFKGTSIYFLGFDKQPSFLPKSGRGFSGLKHVLELLRTKFRKFELTVTPEECSVTKDGPLAKVRISGSMYLT